MNYDRRQRHSKYIPATKPTRREFGVSGTRLYGGRISGYEKNDELYGLNGVLASEEMYRTDAAIFRHWQTVKQTLLSADYYVKPGIEGDPTAEIFAEFIRENFGLEGRSGRMSLSLEAQAAYLFQFYLVGFRYAEELYKMEKDKRGNYRVYLDRYADREPSSHDKWISRDGQTLDAVLQRQYNVQITPEPIPANKLLLLTFDQTGNNFEGIGLYRRLWYVWRSKQDALDSVGISISRFGTPTVKINFDRSQGEMLGLTDGDMDAMRDDAYEQGAAVAAGESAVLLENPVVTFDTYGIPPNQNAGTIDYLNFLDNQIAQAFGSQFQNLGISDTGARSVGEIHLSVFRRSMINVLDLFCNAINGPDRAGGGTIGRLIKYNFGVVDPSKLPMICHSGLDNDELMDSIGNNSLQPLVDSGIITPTDNLERNIRSKLGIDELPKDAERTPLERAAAKSGGSTAMLAASALYRKRSNDE